MVTNKLKLAKNHVRFPEQIAIHTRQRGAAKKALKSVEILSPKRSR